MIVLWVGSENSLENLKIPLRKVEKIFLGFILR